MREISKMSEPMLKTLLAQQLQIKILTYDIGGCNKKIRALKSEIKSKRRRLDLRRNDDVGMMLVHYSRRRIVSSITGKQVREE